MTAARTPSSCPHRRVNDPSGATCALLGEMTGVQQHPAMLVEIDACQACCESFPPSTTDLNPVLASLLHHMTEEIAAAGGVDGCDLDRANELNLWAEHSLPAVTPDEDDTVDHSRASYDHLRGITVEQIETHLPQPPRGGPAVKTWAVGVTTSPRRMPTLETCVGSILDSGWDDPILFIDGEVDLPESIAHLENCRRRPGHTSNQIRRRPESPPYRDFRPARTEAVRHERSSSPAEQ